MKVFDIAIGVIEAKSDELSSTHKLNNENLKIFEGYCRVLDDIFNDGWGNKISVDIIEPRKFVRVDLYVMDFTYQPGIRSKNYFDILKRANLVQFTNEDGEYIKVTFVFPTLFDEI